MVHSLSKLTGWVTSWFDVIFLISAAIMSEVEKTNLDQTETAEAPAPAAVGKNRVWRMDF